MNISKRTVARAIIWGLSSVVISFVVGILGLIVYQACHGKADATGAVYAIGVAAVIGGIVYGITWAFDNYDNYNS